MSAERKRKYSAGYHVESYDVPVGQTLIDFHVPQDLFPEIETSPSKREPNGGMRKVHAEDVISDPEKLNKYLNHFPQVSELFEKYHGFGDVWATVKSHKLQLTIISAAAAAAGVIGIGIRLKRREDNRRKKSKMNLSLIKLSFLSFLLFGIFTFFVNLNLLESFDNISILFLQNLISRSFDYPFSILSLIGSFEIVIVFLLIVSALYRKLRIFIVLLFFGLFHVIELIGKAFIDHPGPPSEFHRYLFGVNFPSAFVDPGFSYPSGHSGRMIFILIILAFVIWKSKLSNNLKLILFIILSLVSFLMLVSRIYLGEHWSSDVIGGSLLGAAFGILSIANLKIKLFKS